MKKDISLEMLSEILSLSKKIVKPLSNYISTKIPRFKTRMFLFDHAKLANGDTQNSHD